MTEQQQFQGKNLKKKKKESLDSKGINNTPHHGLYNDPAFGLTICNNLCFSKYLLYTCDLSHP